MYPIFGYTLPAGLLALASLHAPAASSSPRILPGLRASLVCAYDFEHPAPDDPARELDQGASGAALLLVNGGSAMRVADSPAGSGPGHSLQTRQITTTPPVPDDWKSGNYQAGGLPALAPFRAAAGITLMGWVKSTAPALRPALDLAAKAPGGRYPGVCLFGLLHGASDGHHVRALVEFIHVDGKLRLVALGRRRDAGPALVLAASAEPDTILPPDTWVHLAATFDYTRGVCVLYRDGHPLDTLPLRAGDPWALAEDREPAGCSDTLPTGIKIGGSHPQNTRDRNPFDGRFDDLFFFNRALSPEEILRQYAHARARD